MIPSILNTISHVTVLATLLITAYSISSHLSNYRKPSHQRLIIRIQLMIPLYTLSCFFLLDSPPFPKFLGKSLSIIVEVYEAFVIYTFFSLLTVYLGDERDIIIKNSGREPVRHVIFSRYLPLVDISDPFTFLAIKRGILQYVWLKPLICLATVVNEVWFDDNGTVYVIITVIYNLSVSVSLYDLALFWSCLYEQLTPFKPWGKFLNVKLIIFASYWQTLIISILNLFGVLDPNIDYQALLMSWELLGFAISHLTSFSYHEYDSNTLQGCARFPYAMALKDTIGIHDLVYDFKKTLYGSSYDYRSFDSVESIIAHPNSQSRLRRLNHGLRYSGDKKYWLYNTSQDITAGSINMKTPLLSVDFSDQRRDSVNSSIKGIYPQSLKSNHTGHLQAHIQTLATQTPNYTKHYNESIKSYQSLNSNELSISKTDQSQELQDPDNETAQLLSEYVHDSTYYDVIKADAPFGDKNSPVVYEYEDYAMSAGIRRLREERNRGSRRSGRTNLNLGDLV